MRRLDAGPAGPAPGVWPDPAFGDSLSEGEFGLSCRLTLPQLAGAAGGAVRRGDSFRSPLPLRNLTFSFLKGKAADFSQYLDKMKQLG